MNRVRKLGIPCPTIYLVDETDRKIYMEYLGNHSITLKDFFRQLEGDWSSPIVNVVLDTISKNLAEMHKGDIIHGDLTTSNMMLKPNLPTDSLFSLEQPKMSAQDIIASGSIGELYFIDFGLSQVSSKIEDKAVDIYVLKRAFISTHPGSDQIFERIIENYKNLMSHNNMGGRGLQIIAKFRDVEKRGRKRECFG